MVLEISTYISKQNIQRNKQTPISIVLIDDVKVLLCQLLVLTLFAWVWVWLVPPLVFWQDILATTLEDCVIPKKNATIPKQMLCKTPTKVELQMAYQNQLKQALIG
jgi:hypothetical protein